MKHHHDFIDRAILFLSKPQLAKYNAKLVESTFTRGPKYIMHSKLGDMEWKKIPRPPYHTQIGRRVAHEQHKYVINT